MGYFHRLNSTVYGYFLFLPSSISSKHPFNIYILKSIYKPLISFPLCSLGQPTKIKNLKKLILKTNNRSKLSETKGFPRWIEYANDIQQICMEKITEAKVIKGLSAKVRVPFTASETQEEGDLYPRTPYFFLNTPPLRTGSG